MSDVEGLRAMLGTTGTSGIERPVHLSQAEGESLMGPWEETRVLDVDDSSYSALRKLQDHQRSFGGNEELAPPGMVREGGELFDDPLDPGAHLEDFFYLITEKELPIGEENLQQIVHQHAQNALSTLNSSVRLHDPSLRVMDLAVTLGAFARLIYQRARDIEPEDWSG